MGMERSKMDRGEEPFPSRSMMFQSGQKALHQFRFPRISQNLHLFHNLWPFMINLWHFCMKHHLCCPIDPEGWIPIHYLHWQEAEEADGESTPLPTMTGIDWGQTGEIIQILKKRKNTGRKFCPCHTEWST
ncbi:unnamed protein product [Prunus armeniaca]